MKNLVRRFILAAVLMAGLAPAFAQSPTPVPALPDTERRTSYTISSSQCTCAVNFALYGDSTDYQNWVEVWLNGVLVQYNDQTFGWQITSPTGPLGNIARPITDAVLTFNYPQTGTVQIVGARRPRRVSQFSENAGVSARNLNQALTDIVAQNRETWDKINDVTGRVVLAPAGETLALLPLLASRQNMGACFDSNGNLTSCVGVPSTTFIAGTGIQFTGTNPTTIALTPTALAPNSQTGNYTIQNSDCGRLILATGGLNTLTLPAASSVTNGCEVAVKNGDSGRGKNLVNFPSDLPTILWPLQTNKVKSNGAIWLSTYNPGKWQPTSAAIFNVSTTGSDDGECLGTGTAACASITTTMAVMCQNLDPSRLPNAPNQVVLQIANGTYNQTITPFCDPGPLPFVAELQAGFKTINGNWNNGAPLVTLSCGASTCVAPVNSNGWYIQGIATTGTNPSMVVDGNSFLYFGHMLFGTTGSNAVDVNVSAAIAEAEADWISTGNKSQSISITNRGLYVSRTITQTIVGNPTYSLAWMTGNLDSVALMAGVTFSGAANVPTNNCVIMGLGSGIQSFALNALPCVVQGNTITSPGWAQ
jgi:hypothetical protein